MRTHPFEWIGFVIAINIGMSVEVRIGAQRPDGLAYYPEKGRKAVENASRMVRINQRSAYGFKSHGVGLRSQLQPHPLDAKEESPGAAASRPSSPSPAAAARIPAENARPPSANRAPMVTGAHWARQSRGLSLRHIRLRQAPPLRTLAHRRQIAYRGWMARATKITVNACGKWLHSARRPALNTFTHPSRVTRDRPRRTSFRPFYAKRSSESHAKSKFHRNMYT